MYGWINDCVEKLVIEKFGLDAWHAIKEKAGCTMPDGAWVRLDTYPDGDTVNLVMAAAEALNVGADDVLELFGQYFIQFVKKEGYANLLRCQGDSLKGWMNSINDLHLHLEHTMPEIVAPEFWCIDDPEVKGALILRYRSQRGTLLAPLVVGVVKEVAVMYFQTNIVFERKTLQNDDEGERFTSWRITLAEEQPEDFDGDYENALLLSKHERLKRRSGKKNASGKCPFSAAFSNSDFNLRADDLCNIFPFHIVIDQDFKIIQMGDKMDDVFNFKRGETITEIFAFAAPPQCPWEWSSIKPSKDLTIELKLVNDAYLNNPQVVAKHFKGSIFLFDPAENPSIEDFRCLFLISPKLTNLADLNESGFTLSDIPSHTMQREHIMLAEHHASETRTAHRLEILSTQLEQEKRLSNSLLEMMLPEKVAEDLRAGRKVLPEQFENCSIFFSDIVGFTNISSQLEPIRVVELLNQLYTVMDNVTTAFGLYKVETIGDAYMVVGGIPTRDPLHAIKLANFAVVVAKAVQTVKSPLDGTPIRIRMGIHAGKTMAGVVGNMMPRYCLFGDTVNTASRMESNSESGLIQISEAFYDCIAPSQQFAMTPRGEIPIKGKGNMKTYWLDGAKDCNLEANTAAIERYVEISEALVAEAIAKKDEGYVNLRDNSGATRGAREMRKVNSENSLMQALVTDPA